MAVQYTILQCDLNYLISILGKWQQEHAILLIKTLSNRFQNRQALNLSEQNYYSNDAKVTS